MKTTPWFPAHVKPVRKGVYEWDLADGHGAGWFRYWTGHCWLAGSDNKKEAALSTHPILFCLQEGEKWRGLASKDGK